MKAIKLIIIVAFSVALAACAGKADKQANATSAQQSGFTLPSVPASIHRPEQRAAFLATHYWEKFNFTDTTLLTTDSDDIEQAFSNFTALLPVTDYATASSAVAKLMSLASATPSMFNHFYDLADKYFHDVNSPSHCDEYFIPVLQAVIASPLVPAEEKIRPRYQLRMALKNRIGTPATDFAYTLRDGTVHRLSQVSSTFTILYFNRPDCNDCRTAARYIASSQVLNDLHDSGILSILAIYPDGNTATWRKAQYPGIFINGCDSGKKIDATEAYDLRAIPCLYLLDSSRHVVLKDARVEAIEQYLISAFSRQ